MTRFRTRKAATYRSSHHCNKNGRLTSTALLVIDVQRRYADPDFKERGSLKTHRVAHKITQFLPIMRNLGIPIYFAYLYRQGHDEAPGDPENCCGGFHLVRPASGDQLVPKTGASSFTSSDMPERLLHAGHRHLIMVGFNSSACIRHSALDAKKQGFDVTVLKDLVENDVDNNRPKIVRLKTLRQKGVKVCLSGMFSRSIGFLK